MKDDLFNFDESLAGGFDMQSNNDYDAKLKKARILCIRGRFDQALAICEEILEEDMENMGAYIEILRVHTEDFTVFEGKDIEQDIHAIERLFPDIDNEEYIDYLQKRNKFLKSADNNSNKKDNNVQNATPTNENTPVSTPENNSVVLENATPTPKKGTSKKKSKSMTEAEALNIIRQFDKLPKHVVDEAKEIYDEYAENGSTSALCNIGYYCASGECGYAVDEKKAFEYNKKSADLGSSAAYYNLGIYYTNGVGTAKNAKKAFESFNKAYELGDVDAIEQVAKCYQNGEGVARNVKNAIEILEKGVAKGSANAMFALAEIFIENDTPFSDFDKALDLYQKAADLGHQEAKKALDEIGEMMDAIEGIASMDKNELNQFENWLDSVIDGGASMTVDQAKKIIENSSKHSANELQKAKKSLETLAEKGNSDALFYLGYYHSKGQYGYVKDKEKAFEFYKKSADLGDETAMYNVGLFYSKGTGIRKNQKKAFEYFMKSADKGDKDALYKVGICYRDGSGVEQDNKKAIEFLKKAVNAGNKDAATALKELENKSTMSEGALREIIENQSKYSATKVNEAKKAYEELIKNGDRIAICNMGYYFNNGKFGYPKDSNKAFEYYSKAAKLGDVTAFYNLGICYEYGTGCVKNLSKAFSNYKSSADLGDADALYKVGCFYRDGFGVTKNITSAKEFLKKAADKGQQKAKDALATLNISMGESDAKNIIENQAKYTSTKIAEAKKAYEEHAKNGSSAANCNIGLYHSLGKFGYVQDKKKAFDYYTKAAGFGSKEAMFNLGIYYRYGYAGSVNLTKSFEFYKKSADLNDIEAMYETGRCYRDGMGTAVDLAKAKEYFTKGAQNGNQKSKDALASLPTMTSSQAREIIENQSKYTYSKIAEAKKSYETIALNGNSNALCTLGYYYDTGKYGYVQDKRKAYDYYKKSADMGCETAFYNLAVFYESGTVVTKSLYQAFEYYKKAADMGWTSAMYETGCCYRDGLGTAKNTTKAVEYFRKAAAKGHQGAKDALKRMGY